MSLRESFSKHWQVAKEAYAQEKKRATNRLPIHQKDFLPATLEIMEKPASPAGRLSMWVILSFFVLTIAWAIIGHIDVVSTAQGKIVPVGQSKIIQSIETGAVKSIQVENGMRVAKGDVLIELDTTFSDADVDRFTREHESALLTRVRSRWLLSQFDHYQNVTKQTNQQIAPILFFPIEIAKEQSEVQSLLAESQWSEHVAVEQTLKEQLLERRANLRVTQRNLEKFTETLPLLQEQVKGVTELESKGLFPRFQYLEYEERLIARKKDIEVEKNKLEQAQAAIKSSSRKIDQHQQEFRKEVISQLAEATDTLLAADKELVKARRTSTLQVIRSPVDGVVQQLSVNTVGGVVSAGDLLMVIVPENRTLQVEVSILNKDIGFVTVSQDVEVKFDAFSFTKYGVGHGKVISIDRDAVQDEHLGLVYPARISLNEKTIKVNGNDIPISPGMSLSAEIKTSNRRVIEFIMSPMLRYKDESLRER